MATHLAAATHVCEGKDESPVNEAEYRRPIAVFLRRTVRAVSVLEEIIVAVEVDVLLIQQCNRHFGIVAHRYHHALDFVFTLVEAGDDLFFEDTFFACCEVVLDYRRRRVETRISVSEHLGIVFGVFLRPRRICLLTKIYQVAFLGFQVHHLEANKAFAHFFKHEVIVKHRKTIDQDLLVVRYEDFPVVVVTYRVASHYAEVFGVLVGEYVERTVAVVDGIFEVFLAFAEDDRIFVRGVGWDEPCFRRRAARMADYNPIV